MTTQSPPQESYEVDMTLWQREFGKLANQNNLDGPGYLRLSQSGQCIRRLYYTHLGEIPSNPTHSSRRNQLTMGHALEVLAIIDFKNHGWETRHTCLDDGGQLTVEVAIPGLDRPVTGHPDGTCRHEEFTNNKWVPLEVKSMSEFRAEQVAAIGLIKVEPSYLMQIAMYAPPLYQQGLVDYTDRGVFNLITRAAQPMPPEFLRWKPDLSQRGINRLALVVTAVDDGTPPERPYSDPTESPCSYCPFQKTCWGDEFAGELMPITRGQPTDLDHDPDAVQAAQDWAYAKELMDSAKAVLEAKLTANNNAPIAAAGVKAEFFRPNESNNFDMYALGRYLTGEILRNNQNPNKRNRVFWVHHL